MEQWLPAYGFEQTHEVSSEGRVRSRNKVLAPQLRPNGYPTVSLCAGGKEYTKSVHRLVAMSFIPGDHSLTVNHKNGNKTHNAEDNLEWMTQANNVRHACNTGLRPETLTDTEQAELFADYLTYGYTQQVLADKYGIDPSSITRQLKALRPSKPQRAVAVHGTRSRYTHGCRCVPCRAAKAESVRQYKKRVQYPLTSIQEK